MPPSKHRLTVAQGGDRGALYGPAPGFNAEYKEVTAVEVLVTGGDTELGRAVAERFHDEGHTITLLGARRDELEVAAKEIEADAIVCDNTDPAALAQVRHLFPHHLDTIVNIPAPRWPAGDPRAYPPG
jgi:nucleoside-diphosphate-sugar epimerase